MPKNTLFLLKNRKNHRELSPDPLAIGTNSCGLCPQTDHHWLPLEVPLLPDLCISSELCLFKDKFLATPDSQKAYTFNSLLKQMKDIAVDSETVGI